MLTQLCLKQKLFCFSVAETSFHMDVGSMSVTSLPSDSREHSSSKVRKVRNNRIFFGSLAGQKHACKAINTAQYLIWLFWGVLHLKTGSQIKFSAFIYSGRCYRKVSCGSSSSRNPQARQVLKPPSHTITHTQVAHPGFSRSWSLVTELQPERRKVGHTGEQIQPTGLVKF